MLMSGPTRLRGACRPSPADMWSIGCIFAELLMLHSPFKGKEVKARANERNPFQRSQLEKIFEYLGLPVRTFRSLRGRRARTPTMFGKLIGLGGGKAPRTLIMHAHPGDRWPGVRDLPEFGQLSSFNRRCGRVARLVAPSRAPPPSSPPPRGAVRPVKHATVLNAASLPARLAPSP